MGLALGKLTMVENGSAASKIAKVRFALLASMAAAMPETPAPTIARSSTPSSDRRRAAKSGSRRMACTARAPVSEENFRSGIPVRSPTMRTPGTAVVPSSRTSGSRSTVPAGHRVCSQRVYRDTGFIDVALYRAKLRLPCPSFRTSSRT